MGCVWELGDVPDFSVGRLSTCKPIRTSVRSLVRSPAVEELPNRAGKAVGTLTGPDQLHPLKASASQRVSQKSVSSRALRYSP